MPRLARRGEKPDTFTGLALAPNEGRTVKGARMKKHQTPASPKADANTGFKLGFDSEAAFVIGLDGEKYDGTEGDLASMAARYIEQERIERERLFDGLKRAAEFQGKCEDDAAEFVALYWSGYDGKSNTLCLEKFERWLQDHEPLDRWFYIHLIEAAGAKALELGYSQHKSDIAKSKNAQPRAWVLSEWHNRTDKGQSKASFARQYAPIVKKRFPKDSAAVTPDTIAREWLPKAKKAAPK
ncbi:hypothetical protein [Candidatus Skiveiella danica]|uniref:hypothetical protein n=1 Tax=Candidatus Skiveiella danica TaxID=3386177 RepID=UPI0009C66FD5|nr:hypothetical protein [Comamonadaceae bacterium]OQC17671.1 MAG: hypothetical protein BWX79_00249 [Alphaproteobacteria bacterium ADurb.Bin100]